MAPVATGPIGKPFTGLPDTPTVSPYLNLFREESADAAPNYFAFVRPQIQQQAALREQQQQLRTLERQVRQASIGAPATAGGRSSQAARYGDTGRYYSGWRR